MPTFGHSADDNDAEYDSAYILGSKFTCLEMGIATKISNKLKNNTGSSQNCKCAIYKVSDNSFVCGSVAVSIADAFDGWKDFPLSGLLLNAEYYLLWWDDSAIKHYYLNAGTNVYGQNIPYNAYPDPLIPGPPFGGEYLIYVTYTPSAPAVRKKCSRLVSGF